MLAGRIVQATSGLKGFDANSYVSPAIAAQMRNAGYRFAIRYVPRHNPNPHDLSTSEAAGILHSGLALMIVQHVNNPNWVATGALGKEYGAFAAQSALEIGYRPGATLWCDLEGVERHTDYRDVIAFCNNWLDKVGYAGYTPGLYVGYQPILTAEQLYRRLRFEHYWGAYNINSDEIPVVRGLQMKQGIERVLFGLRFDPDTITADALGGLPLMMADQEWTP